MTVQVYMIDSLDDVAIKFEGIAKLHKESAKIYHINSSMYSENISIAYAWERAALYVRKATFRKIT